jgi:hypothetical protein
VLVLVGRTAAALHTLEMRCVMYTVSHGRRKEGVCVHPALLITKATRTLDDTSTSSGGDGERLVLSRDSKEGDSVSDRHSLSATQSQRTAQLLPPDLGPIRVDVSGDSLR